MYMYIYIYIYKNVNLIKNHVTIYMVSEIDKERTYLFLMV